MESISTKVLDSVLQTGALAFVIPVVMIAAWKMRTRKSLVPFFIGAFIFVVFARGLEMLPHTLFILTDNPVSRVVTGNVVLYALYGGLAAGIFEESGRFLAYRYLLKKHTAKETAITYGIGHGGAECMLILGVGYIQYYFYGQLINNGTISEMMQSYQGNADAQASLQAMVDSVSSLTRFGCWMAGWERISAMMLQIALSVLVFQAVRVAGKRYMFGVAILLHAVANFPAAFYQAGMINIVAVECIIFALAVAIFLYAIQIYRNMEIQEENTAEAEDNRRRHELHQMANQRFRDKGQE